MSDKINDMKINILRLLSENAELKRERDEAREDLKITQEAWVKAKFDRVESLRERDEAIELLKIASWYATTTTQEMSEKFLRKIGIGEGTK